MKKLLGLTLAAVVGFNAPVEDVSAEGMNPFVDCGIGAALFPDTHWAAVTSNIIWDVGTTALTSGTMSPETCSGSDAEVAEFINHSYDNLIEETARGEGEHVVAMLNIYGCDAEARANIVADVRGDMSKVVADADFSAQTHETKVAQYFNVVNSTVKTKFAASCSAA